MKRTKAYLWLRKVPIFIMIVLLSIPPFQIQEVEAEGNLIPEVQLVWEDLGDGNARIINYTGPGGHDLIIPETVGGLRVTEITRDENQYQTGFQEKGLTGSISIPPSVTSIENYAFFDNQLTSVELPSSVTSIGEWAFSHNQLTSIALPSNLVHIDNYVFSNNQLTSIEIPSSVTSIGYFAFTNNQLTSVEIPSSVTSIGSYAFSHNQLTSVELPSGLVHINNNVFTENQLTSIEIPSSVTSIGEWAFAENQLTNIVIPSSVTSIGMGAFNTNLLSNVELQFGITSIGDAAFYDNQLTNIVIPSSVTSIRSSAFENNQLTSVEIPSSVTSIDAYTFYGNQLTNVVIPSSVTSIGDRAFSNNQLERIEIPNSVTSIGAWAFSDNQLTEVLFLRNGTWTMGSNVFLNNPLQHIYGYRGSTAETYLNDKFFAIEEDTEVPKITLNATSTEPTNEDVEVIATITDNIAIVERKWASGDQTATFFDTDGTPFTTSFTISESGMYTVYARDLAGNESVKSIEITNIDREKPVITLVGEATISVTQGSSFIDPGATATDNLDGDITSGIVVTGTVDTNLVGEYTLTYQVTDRVGNVADAVTRIVKVTAPPTSGGGSYTPPTAPSTSNTEINPSLGGVISTGDMSITFPPAAFDRTFTVVIEKVRDLKVEWQPNDKAFMSEVFEITKDQDGNFDKPVTITLPFQLENTDRGKYDIAIYWLNETTGDWIQLDNIKVDWNQGEVSGDVNHFTKFAVLATETVLVELSDIIGHWAEDHIIQLVATGAISGYPDGTFKPNNPITRAEFTAIVVRALGLEMSGSKTFQDTNNHWAKDVIATAYEHGIIQGYNETTFGANDPITREQMAAIIVNAFELQQGDDNTFTDQEHISPWAQEAIQKALSNGMITGYEDNTFKPKNNATRAEAVTVIVRAIEKE